MIKDLIKGDKVKAKGWRNRRGKYKEFIEQFVVGLIEGDGSIAVIHRSEKKKEVRIIVALKNLASNERMLRILMRKIGGESGNRKRR